MCYYLSLSSRLSVFESCCLRRAVRLLKKSTMRCVKINISNNLCNIAPHLLFSTSSLSTHSQIYNSVLVFPLITTCIKSLSKDMRLMLVLSSRAWALEHVERVDKEFPVSSGHESSNQPAKASGRTRSSPHPGSVEEVLLQLYHVHVALQLLSSLQQKIQAKKRTARMIKERIFFWIPRTRKRRGITQT